MLTSQSRARFGPQSYRTTCRPSAVPVPQGALPPAARWLPAAVEPRDRLRPRAVRVATSRRGSGRRADPGGQAGALRLQRPGPGDGLAGGEEPLGLPSGSRRHPGQEGLLRQGRRRGDRRQARLEHLQRAVRRQLPGQVHPHRQRHLPRELLSGWHSSGGSGGAQPPESDRLDLFVGRVGSSCPFFVRSPAGARLLTGSLDPIHTCSASSWTLSSTPVVSKRTRSLP